MVILTRNYLQLLQADCGNVCKDEFLYFCGHHSAKHAFIVILEESLCDQSHWPQLFQDLPQRVETITHYLNPADTRKSLDELLQKILGSVTPISKVINFQVESGDNIQGGTSFERDATQDLEQRVQEASQA